MRKKSAQRVLRDMRAQYGERLYRSAAGNVDKMKAETKELTDAFGKSFRAKMVWSANDQGDKVIFSHNIRKMGLLKVGTSHARIDVQMSKKPVKGAFVGEVWVHFMIKGSGSGIVSTKVADAAYKSGAWKFSNISS